MPVVLTPFVVVVVVVIGWMRSEGVVAHVGNDRTVHKFQILAVGVGVLRSVETGIAAVGGFVAGLFLRILRHFVEFCETFDVTGTKH